jgi:hypothetical protein
VAPVRFRAGTAHPHGYGERRLNTFRECIMSLSHYIDNYVRAGRYFPDSPPASRVSLAWGKSTTCSTLLRWWSRKPFDGPHSFWGKRGLPFLATHL